MEDRWTARPDEAELRRALTRLAPELPSLPMRINPSVEQPDPLFWSGSAWLVDQYVVKYAWSDVRTERLWREGVIFDRLHAHGSPLPVPEVVVANEAPSLLVTKAVAGVPLTVELASRLTSGQLCEVADQLGSWMSRLHSFDGDELLGGLPVVVPHAQSTTALLRDRFPHIVDERRTRTVLGWCDWVDDVLQGSSAPSEVIVHGDLHGHNQVWDPDTLDLEVVVDLGECGLHDPHFDFRYVPGNADSLELVRAVVDAYTKESGRTPRMERIMGWHVLTHLGDALWRTEAGVDLPGGGDATSWVDDLERRLADL